MARTYTKLIYHIVFSTKERIPLIAWQNGYGAFSVSESQVAAVRKYIQQQEEHHKRISFKDELISLLRKHRIEFDEGDLFD